MQAKLSLPILLEVETTILAETMAILQFIGAARQVTGSCHMIRTERTTILLDCGMNQGGDKADEMNAQPFPFDPKQIDAVILSHAHIDHSGLLPKLTKEGFSGVVYSTLATYDLIELMLKDSAKLAQKDVEWENKHRRRADRELIEPLYDLGDVDTLLEQRQAVEYGLVQAITSDIDICFREAGHILGSAIVEVFIHENGKQKKLVYSGDLGNDNQVLLRDPDIIQTADLLLLESTYGDRLHRNLPATLEEFYQALEDAANGGGNVLIPSFSVGRTQELLYYLGLWHRSGKLKQKRVFLDSPMAISASDIYQRHIHLFSHEDSQAFNTEIKKGWQQWLPILRCTRSTEESMEINRIHGGVIIIAGNGMCTGGRIVHHFKNQLWRHNTHVIIVGFQAKGTTGRALVDGVKRVNVLGNDIAVKAKIHTLGGLSAHADQSQLLQWASEFKEPKPDLYLVHGELDKMLILQKAFHEQYSWYANIPAVGDVVNF